eukprot:5668275-Amphidinium_carterae.1
MVHKPTTIANEAAVNHKVVLQSFPTVLQNLRALKAQCAQRGVCSALLSAHIIILGLSPALWGDVLKRLPFGSSCPSEVRVSHAVASLAAASSNAFDASAVGPVAPTAAAAEKTPEEDPHTLYRYHHNISVTSIPQRPFQAAVVIRSVRSVPRHANLM